MKGDRRQLYYGDLRGDEEIVLSRLEVWERDCIFRVTKVTPIVGDGKCNKQFSKHDTRLCDTLEEAVEMVHVLVDGVAHKLEGRVKKLRMADAALNQITKKGRV